MNTRSCFRDGRISLVSNFWRGSAVAWLMSLFFAASQPNANAQAPGTLDPLNAQIVGSSVHAMVVQLDGKRIIAGSFVSVLGVPRRNIARLNTDGSLDLSFDPNANSSVTTVAALPDGRILIGGNFTTLQPNGAVAATPRNYIARLNADGSLDSTFDPNANELVNCIVPQRDGKIVIGGEFTALQPNGAATATTRNRIARLEADGSLDAAFDPNANDDVTAVAVQLDGKILLGGFFTTLQPNGAATATARNRIARLNSNGTLDAGFDPNANGSIWTLVVQADGKILLGGDFTTLQPNGAATATTRNRLARLNVNGTLDGAFDPSPTSLVRSLVVQADGKVLIGGQFLALQPNGAASPTPRKFLARVFPDGSLDLAFDPSPSADVYSVAIDAAGKIMVGGLFSQLQPNGAASPTPRNRFALLNNDAATQTLVTAAGAPVIWQRGGAAPELTRVVFERSTDGGASWTQVSIGFRIAGTADWQTGDFGLTGAGLFRAVGFTSGGANSGSSSPVQQMVSVNYSTAGTLAGLDANITGGYVMSAVTQPDGKRIIAGSFTSVLGVPRANIARLNADGTPDAGFDPKANNAIFSVALQGDGKILLGGHFSTLQPNGAASATTRNRIARLNTDGSLDMSFDPNASSSIQSIVIQADGKILLGGNFITLQPNGAVSATTRNRIARLNADGSLDAGFDPNANNSVYVVMLQPDGKILLGGNFTTLQPNSAVAATPRNRVARVNGDGTLDAGFDPNANNLVLCAAQQADGKILLGGSFTALQPNGAASATTRNRIARLNADGTLDPGFNPNANEFVYSLAVQADGDIVIGGKFTALQPDGVASAFPRGKVARLNANGSLDLGFDPTANNTVLSVALQSDGRVLLGGLFSTLQPNGAASATPRNLFALLVNGAATQSLSAANAATVTWQRGGTAPDLSQAMFEASANGGMSWTLLGNGARVGTTAAWRITGLALPTSTITRIRATGRVAGGAFDGSGGLVQFEGNVNPQPAAATDILLSASSIAENNAANATVGLLTAVDPDVGDTHTFTLVPGPGATSADNGSFSIAGNALRLTPSANFEVKSSYSIYIRAEDDDEDIFSKAFTITITNVNEMPSFTVGANVTLPFGTSTMQTIPGWATNIDDGDSTVTQALSFTTTVASGAGIFAIPPAIAGDGTLSFATNGTPGLAVVNVSLTDDTSLGGPALTSVAQTFTIRVEAAVVTVPGTLDPLDAGFLLGEVYALAVQPDGKRIVAGEFTSAQGVPRNNILRLNADGTLDMSFDPNVTGTVVAVAVQPDGKIVLAGNFTSLQPNGAASATPRRHIARVNADGTLDAAFDPNPNGLVLCLALQPDGKILLGGVFGNLQPNGAASPTARTSIARVNGDGSVDESFGASVTGQVYCTALQADGRVLIGGNFLMSVTDPGTGTPISIGYLARLDANGGLDASFSPQPNAAVRCLVVDADQKVLVGGDFFLFTPDSLGTVNRQFVARINTNGTVDAGFDPRANRTLRSLARQADGKVLLGGDFTTLQPNGGASPTTRNYVARVNADGSLDTVFDPNADYFVNAIAVQADGKVMLGGGFISLQPNGAASAVARNIFALVNNDLATQTLGAVDATQVLWQRGGAAPEVSHVTFEQSLDGGATWAALGNATRVAGATSNWQLTGLALAGSGQLRARARTHGGFGCGSNGLIESLASFTATPANPNQLPSFTKGADAYPPVNLTDEQIVPGWATNITDGDAAVTQALTFNVTVTSGATLFTIAPAIASDGTLRYTHNGTPGTAVISVTLTDDATAGGPARTTAPQTFSITIGNAPEIVMHGGTRLIFDKDTTPRAEDGTDFGAAGGSSIARSFSIQNCGNRDLILGAITMSGPHVGDFIVTPPPVSVLPQFQETFFQVTFTPSGTGLRTAVVNIASNDPDENPFTFAVSGAGLSAAQLFANATAAAGLSGADATPDAMPFNDGVSNLLKYAFNMNLSGPDSSVMVPGGTSGLPLVTVQASPLPAIRRYEFVRRIGSGLIYTPQKSFNLTAGAWITLTATPTITPIDAAWERVVYEEPCNPLVHPCYFGRVLVEMP